MEKFFLIITVCSLMIWGCMNGSGNDSSFDVVQSPFVYSTIEDSIKTFIMDTQRLYDDDDLDKLEICVIGRKDTTISAFLSPEIGVPYNTRCIGGCSYMRKKMIVFCSVNPALFHSSSLSINKAYEYAGEQFINRSEQEAKGLMKEWRLVQDSCLVLVKTTQIRMKKKNK